MTTRPGPKTARNRVICTFRPALQPETCPYPPAITADILQPAGPAVLRVILTWGVTRGGAACQSPHIDLLRGLAEKAPLRRGTPATMHTLFLHNSLTRRKERFEVLDPQHVRMY